MCRMVSIEFCRVDISSVVELLLRIVVCTWLVEAEGRGEGRNSTIARLHIGRS